MSEDRKLHAQEYNLDADSELRFEIETKGEKVLLMLKSGFAEVFGTELVKGKPYEFTSGAKVAVFTWHGCTLELRGRTDVSYTAKETPMVMYANCHAALEQIRTNAEKDNRKGPICMVVGPCDVGKSTLCRILLNYAVRVGRRPLFVDLDLGQGQIALPGTIGITFKTINLPLIVVGALLTMQPTLHSCMKQYIKFVLGALLVERPSSIDEGFSQEAPLVYHFGHKTPSINVTLYKTIVGQLAKTVKERVECNRKSKGC